MILEVGTEKKTVQIDAETFDAIRRESFEGPEDDVDYEQQEEVYEEHPVPVEEEEIGAIYEQPEDDYAAAPPPKSQAQTKKVDPSMNPAAARGVRQL